MTAGVSPKSKKNLKRWVKKTYFNRFCKKCGKTYGTPHRYGKLCLDCGGKE